MMDSWVGDWMDGESRGDGWMGEWGGVLFLDGFPLMQDWITARVHGTRRPQLWLS